jgi:hypothetical protein
MSTVPAEAGQVLQAFFDASDKKDIEGMKACLSAATLKADGFNASGPEGLRFVFGEEQMEGPAAVILVKGFPIGAPADSPPAMQMSCVMVLEKGQWKFDLATTAERMMSGMMESAMTQVADTMGKVVDGVGQALASALGPSSETASSKDEEDQSAWDHASLTPEVDELFPLSPMTPLPKTAAAVGKALGGEVHVDAAIEDLLRQLGSTDRAGLVDWMDGSLFAGWEAVFASANGIPVVDRLWTIRIEPCIEFTDRILVLDGSDLVYRLNFNHVSGYFSDEFIASVIPGLLGGLPEKVDTNFAGRRALPLDEDRPTVDFYRQRWVPRWMRRIRELLGVPIQLKVDWEKAVEAPHTGIQLPRWGLNRVYGGLALICVDPQRKAKIAGNLKSIRLDVGLDFDTKYARLEGDTLVVGISYLNADTPGCYETEIATALL